MKYLDDKGIEWKPEERKVFEDLGFNGKTIYTTTVEQLKADGVPRGIAIAILEIIPDYVVQAQAPQPGKPPLLPLYFSGRGVGDEWILLLCLIFLFFLN